VDRGVVLDIAAAATDAAGCQVTGATLDWGFKESFRSYISGSIANGEWTVADGATYETPSFGWVDGTGTYDEATGTGQIAFTGSIRFTGHDGLLDTTVANPVIRYDGPGEATLLLDVSGVTQEGAEVSQEGIDFVTIDLATGDTALTSAGAAAFGTYETGEAFDPVAITSDCVVAAPVEETSTPTPTAAPVEDSTTSPLLVITIAIGALLLIAIVVIVLLLVRRRRP
jgi:hypothetical protein